MSTDYSALLLEYPAVISKDQLYRICHKTIFPFLCHEAVLRFF